MIDEEHKQELEYGSSEFDEDLVLHALTLQTDIDVKINEIFGFQVAEMEPCRSVIEDAVIGIMLAAVKVSLTLECK